jgi:hypothetical protein
MIRNYRRKTMKSRKFIPLGFLLLCVFCFVQRLVAVPREALSADGRATARAELSPEPPRLGENVELTITVTLPTGGEVLPLKFGEEYGPLRVENVKADPPGADEQKHTTIFHVTLTPKESGEAFLPPIPVPCRGADDDRFTLLIPPGRVSVASRFDPNAASLSEIGEPEPPVPRIPWMLLTAVVVGGVVAALILTKVFRKPRTDVSEPLSPRSEALRRLEVLKHSDLRLSDLREYYIHLTGIVRVFIEEMTGIRAPEQTTEEFLRHIEYEPDQNFSPAARRELASFLESADLVKFARFQPTPDEIDAGYRHAELFVSTFEPAVPADPAGEGGG